MTFVYVFFWPHFHQLLPLFIYTFQHEAARKCLDSKKNEMDSLKQSIYGALKRANNKSSSAVGCEKISYVEIPISVKTFKANFLSKVPRLVLDNNFVRSILSVQELEVIVEDKLSPLIHPTASTQQRIVGNVKILYRPKIKSVYSNVNCQRYLYFGYTCNVKP